MEKRECVIIGGGPAGLAAAVEAARAGASVLVIDENRRPGGQLFKQIHKFFGSKVHNAGTRGIEIAANLLKETEELGVEVWLNSAAIGIFEDKKVAVRREGGTVIVQAQQLLICTGGAENALQFPGWTLPGVMGAGAAQTMINVNRVLPGERILVIGSGNVGVIVAYQLLQAGANVVGIVEAMPRIGAYGVHAAKIRRAGVPFYLGHTIARAEGTEKVEAAVIAQLDDKMQQIPGTEKRLRVDTVAVAAGLRPLTELSMMSGIKHDFIPALGGWMPLHDENMNSSVEGIYVAGDTAGVEEASTAMDEGRLAAASMVKALGYLDEETGTKRQAELRERLNVLRQGSFGERRRTAKESVVNLLDGGAKK